jgi:hypothetical protein
MGRGWATSNSDLRWKAIKDRLSYGAVAEQTASSGY